MAFCSSCGGQLPAGATVCPACNTAAAPAAGTTQVAGGGLTDNVAGMLAYITIIPAIIFLVMEPYNKNRFIRFHSFQCIFFWVALVVIHVGLSIVGFVPLMMIVTIPLHFLVWLGSLIIWIILLIKANQGLMYKLPIIGDMAEKQANA
ncbi:MAG: DUF4870 domain-containing protein [Terriglobales bacterium]